MRSFSRTALALLGAAIASCSSPPPGPSAPAPAEPRVAEPALREEASAAEGRLLLAYGHVCVAVRSGVYCRGPAAPADPRGRPVRLTDASDIVGLAMNDSGTVCGRKRRGPAQCWRIADARAAPRVFDAPAIATSVAVGSDGRVCIAGEDGDLWCAAPGEKSHAIETPEPVAAVHFHYKLGTCVLARSGFAHCARALPGPWNAEPTIAVEMSPTIGCLYVDRREVCAFRDERDAAAIERAGYQRDRQFADAIEIYGILRGMVLRSDGRLDFGESWTDLFSESSPRAHPRGVIEVEDDMQRICVLGSTDDVWCVGRNQHGQLGRGSSPVVASPQRVLDDVDEVRASGLRTCARARGASWRCTDHGLFLNVDTDAAGTPRPLAFPIYMPCVLEGTAVKCERFPNGPIDQVLTGAVAVMGNTNFGCAKLRSGKTSCWSGDEPKHRLVQTTLRDPILPPFDKVRHACVVDRDGELWCWGDDSCGALGIATKPRTPTFGCKEHAFVERPTRVPSAPKATAVAVGLDHTCVLTTDRRVACMGDNRRGELGTGKIDDGRYELAIVPDLDDVRAIAAGEDHTCAVRGDRSMWCWGSNHEGQLGADRMPEVAWWARWPLGAAEPSLGESPPLVGKRPEPDRTVHEKAPPAERKSEKADSKRR